MKYVFLAIKVLGYAVIYYVLAKISLKVAGGYFFDSPCISQYNNCGLVYKSSEDITSERSESRHFQRPHDNPSPANPHEYTHKPYLAKNYDPWATFLPLIVWVNLY